MYTHRVLASGWMRLRNSCFGTGDFEGGKATKVRFWTPFPGTLADFRPTRRSSRYDELRRSDWLWTGACRNRLVADWSKPFHHMECLRQADRLCSWGGNGARLRQASSVRSQARSRPRSHHGALWRQPRPTVYWRAVSSSRSGRRRISLCRLPTLGHASVATTSR